MEGDGGRDLDGKKARASEERDNLRNEAMVGGLTGARWKVRKKKLVKTKKLVKKTLPQALIGLILNQQYGPPPQTPDHLKDQFPKEFHDAVAATAAIVEKMKAYDADIIKQYHEKGYAEVQEYVEVEVTDDEEGF